MRLTHKGAGLALILAAVSLSLFLGARADAQTPGTGSLTIATAPGTTAGQVITTLTWTTTPAGAACTASGDWTGTKAASGTETLPAATPPKAYSLRCTWPGDTTATLSWTPPTTNTDGSPLAKCAAATDTGPCLAKYRICRGASATTTTDCRDTNIPAATGSTWTGLAAGTHWFGVKAVTGQGVESALSNTASKSTSAGAEWTASVGVKIPSTATGFAVN